MIIHAIRTGAGLIGLILAAGPGAAGAQEKWSEPAPAAGPASDARAVEYTFRLGELRKRGATAAEHCRTLGSDAVLAGIDYPESGEGAYYKARFECGAPARSGFLVTYRFDDFRRIRGDIDGYCRTRGSRGTAFSEEPAVTVSVSRGMFRCE